MGLSTASHPTSKQTGYLAPEGFVDELVHELGDVQAVHGRLVIAPGPVRHAAWAEDVWFDPEQFPIGSIADGARKLRARGRHWVPYELGHHRRMGLIQRELPRFEVPPLAFPEPWPERTLGSWTLLDEHTVLASARCASPFPLGAVRFVENRRDPPNRAYLKLWEALSRVGLHPRPGEQCLDLGASPGGWTWVCQQLGADVLAVDKAELAPPIRRLPRVHTRTTSAFALDPSDAGPVDWLLSDVVCYPPRLLELVRRWLERGRVRNLVCTLKFQGPTDHETAEAFARIEGSQLLHLHHNRHELTWIRTDS
jgi:23S rRNA (cytidine2498-2'-O)-methyltransferase